VLLPVWRVSEVSLAVYGSTSSPAWKRGPLAPVVVVVGEGQVNLGFRPAVVAMAKVSKALWLIDDEPNQSSGCDSSCSGLASGLA